ncbi:MAG: sulfatase [Rhodospirillaceae bacterium]|nr:sulfatase [Rhodospirillaceae bacterium]
MHRKQKIGARSLKPANLLFLVSDNHQRNYTGCYGHPFVRTPNIDSIAKRGIRFDNAYAASAVCCPARASIATGRYPHQTNYWDNVKVYDGKIPSWHHRLRAAGHEVVSIGKLHYIGNDEGDDYGFTESRLAMHIVERKGALFGLLRATEQGEEARRTPRDNYKKTGIGESDYILYDRQIAEEACAWLDDHKLAGKKPWALKVSFAAPHPPFIVPKRLMDLYPETDMPPPPQFINGLEDAHPAVQHLIWTHSFEDLATEPFLKKSVAGYCSLITHMDEQIGKILQKLHDLELADNTRVVYVSDHGEAVGQHGMFGKSVGYDHSVTVPLVACGPEIPRGQTIGDLVSHVDLFPTFLESLAVNPEPEDADLWGHSLWRIAAGDIPARPAFCEYHAHGSKTGMFMLRRENLKLIYHVGLPAELYDLDSDPHEMHNLADDPAYMEKYYGLEKELRTIVDPEDANNRAKRDQSKAIKLHGGVAKILSGGSYGYNPVPGQTPVMTNFENPSPR